MADARHPKQYPRGAKHPKKPVTKAWKLRVISILEANERAHKTPSSVAELARMIGADKGGLHTMLYSDQATYKYAQQINDVLGIADAMVDNPALTEDEWASAVRLMRDMPEERQRQALAILRTFLIDDEQ